uniref:NAD(P)-binding domain-containing protein n=1 Tax=Alexandrium monilatum TaxID=311494 RepID=A0A7S4T1C5_9DINO|mmetsp:Transcript_66714/g.211075  ORF Transcript_66714/g.211075 Transcript_66714/m.211075 type:complete len:343 (+) Transcript_66714:33-1061(+)
MAAPPARPAHPRALPWQRQRRRPLTSALAGLFVLLCGFTALGSAGPGSSTAAVAAERSSSGAEDLLVVGAGKLGRRTAAQWRQAHPGARVLAATMSTSSHEELRAAGFEPITVEQLQALTPQPTFAHVLFAAPPSRTPEPGAYADAVRAALKLWRSSAGNFVFTSSASVFAEDSGGEVVEESPLSDRPGPQRLLSAERPVLDAGGTVLRLAGLYDLETGPHAYWLKVGVVKGSSSGLINLVHYDDAAAAAVAALARPSDGQGRVFVVSDGEPVTRAEICDSALTSKRYTGGERPRFEDAAAGAGPPPPGGAGAGKRLQAARAMEQLAWRPRYASFPTFMAAS